jgi:hypothetical protein
VSAFLHWLNVELWSPMWPNVFSPNVWTITVVLLHLAVTWIQRERQHLQSMGEARSVRRIAADLFEHHTGRPHPDAPDREGEA